MSCFKMKVGPVIVNIDAVMEQCIFPIASRLKIMSVCRTSLNMEIGTMIVNIDVVMKNVFFPIASMFKKIWVCGVPC